MEHSAAERGPARTGRRYTCNSQICLAYMLSLLGPGLIALGFYRSYNERTTNWLILPSLGVILIFLGSCLYRRGFINLHRARRGRKKRTTSKRVAIGSQLFESQLSLNMLPQCFSHFDTYSGPSRILGSTSHRYLSLPLDSSSPARTGYSPVEVHRSNASPAPASNEVTDPDKSNSNSTATQLEAQTSLEVVGVASSSEESQIEVVHLPVEDTATDDEANDEQSRPPSPVDTEMSSIARESGSNDLPLARVASTESLSTTAEYSASSQNSLAELPSAAVEGGPINEAPPSYEEVIDFDCSVALVNNYRTL